MLYSNENEWISAVCKNMHGFYRYNLSVGEKTPNAHI